MTEAERLANALTTAIKQTDLEDDVIHIARWFVEDAAALLRQQAAEIERLKEASDFDHAEYKRLHDAQAAEIELLSSHLKDACHALTDQKAEIERLRLDATRYAALRDSGHLPPDEFDKQIDAAIALGVKHD